MKQIIVSLTIGNDVSKLFLNFVKLFQTKKLVCLFLIVFARVEPDLIFLAVIVLHSDTKKEATPLIKGIAKRTIRWI